MRPKVVPLMILLPYLGTMLALVAQLDVRPTGDQEIAGSALLSPPPAPPPPPPPRVGNILSWRLIMKYFLWSFVLSRWFKKGSR